MLKNVIVLVIIGVVGYYAYSFYQDNGYESVDADLPPLTSE